MSKQEYLESIFKDFYDGLISEDAYDAALMNIEVFCDNDKE